MSTVARIGEQRVLLDHIRWSTYLAILEDATNCRGRMTYDHGVLEIVSPSKLHENIGRLLGRMVETFTEELEIEIVSVASTTVKLEKHQQGFEADEAYYIQGADLIRHKSEIDPAIDSAPDLVIEVDISRSSLDKLRVFRSFEVSEVWRYEDDALRVYALSGSEYREVTSSRVLPKFPIQHALETLERRDTVGETKLIRGFRQWVRENILAGER